MDGVSIKDEEDDELCYLYTIPVKREAPVEEEVRIKQEAPTKNEVLIQQDVPTNQDVPINQEPVGSHTIQLDIRETRTMNSLPTELPAGRSSPDSDVTMEDVADHGILGLPDNRIQL